MAEAQMKYFSLFCKLDRFIFVKKKSDTNETVQKTVLSKTTKCDQNAKLAAMNLVALNCATYVPQMMNKPTSAFSNFFP